MDEEGWDLAGFCSSSQKSEGNREGEILLRCINVKAELVEVVGAALPKRDTSKGSSPWHSYLMVYLGVIRSSYFLMSQQNKE